MVHGSLPRLTYQTPEEAQAAATDLGLDDIHSHQTAGELVFHPGRSHHVLTERLRELGHAPAPVPGGGMGAEMGESVGAEMDAGLGAGMGMDDRQAEREIMELTGRGDDQGEDENRPGGFLGLGLF